MRIYDRNKQSCEEDGQYGGALLKKLYGTAGGRFLSVLVLYPAFSALCGVYYRSLLSRREILPFIRRWHIALPEYETARYRSFNDFFIRKIREEARPLRGEADALISPADAKLRLFPIRRDGRLHIKGHEYTLRQLTGGVALSGFEGGLCLVFRLSMDDYHRYCFPDDGVLLRKKRLRGRLHTVSDFSNEYRIYQENARLVSILKSRHFGEIIMVEVGALLVGSIVDHGIRRFWKGEEKGFFQLGGSTIVLLLKKNAAVLDKDILAFCGRETEIRVRYRETIGRTAAAEAQNAVRQSCRRD